MRGKLQNKNAVKSSCIIVNACHLINLLQIREFHSVSDFIFIIIRGRQSVSFLFFKFTGLFLRESVLEYGRGRERGRES